MRAMRAARACPMFRFAKPHPGHSAVDRDLRAGHVPRPLARVYARVYDQQVTLKGEITGLGVQRNVCAHESSFRPEGVS